MLIFILFMAIIAAVQALPLSEQEEQQWKEFRLTYNKQYENEKEESIRKGIFAKNMRKFAEHNKRYTAGLVSYTLGVNQFADVTPEEFSKTLTPMNVSALTKGRSFVNQSTGEVPDSIDWREKGAVTPVKYQRYNEANAESAAGALEGQVAINSGRLISFYAEYLSYCVHKPKTPSDFFEYLKNNGGINMRYDFENVTDCSYDPKVSGCKVNGYVTLAKRDEKELLKAVGTKGPVAIVLNANAMLNYRGGVFDGVCDPNNINHSALVVGYGNDNGKDYWLVKNSWGPRFGEKGYIRFARNKNMCGLATLSTYPLLSECT